MLPHGHFPIEFVIRDVIFIIRRIRYIEKMFLYFLRREELEYIHWACIFFERSAWELCPMPTRFFF